MPYIWSFQAAFGRLRGQLSVAPPGASPKSDTLLRVVGLGLVATGMFLIGTVTVVAAATFFIPPTDTGTPLASLKTVTKPQDPQLTVGGDFIRNQDELLELGKALFWDQQVGSDGQACASCHFSAGADPRTRNAISPGLKATPVDNTFSLGGFHAPNSTVSPGELPSHKLSNIDDRTSTVISDSNDVVGSAGVFNRTFSAVGTSPFLSFDRVPSVPDVCQSVADPDGFDVGSVNVRKVEPRNTPTMINAVFNNRNFWDGRAQDIFNGVSPFGARDPTAFVYKPNAAGNIAPTTVQIAFASLASQSVGPPLSNFEMSCANRTFPDVGHKLLSMRPLALQFVSPNDSVLGPLVGFSFTGLSTRYRDMVQQAFNPQWWSSSQAVTISGKSYSQMEANFSLFWGLSVKAYMETLVADDSPVDRFFDRPTDPTAALSNPPAPFGSARRGLNIFQSFLGVAPDPTDPTGTRTINVTLSDHTTPADARCITCHGAAETTNGSISNVQGARLERMTLRDGHCAIYDQGFLNTGVRPLLDDPGMAGTDPSNNSLSETVLAQAGRLTTLVPTALPPFGLDPVLGGTTNCEAPVVTAAFKSPALRNAELTGPYFHNGGQLTLMQIVDFYNRGGDFDTAQTDGLHPIDENIHPLGLAEQDKRDLVAFLVALTDERVAFERAPFDHPGLCVANGQQGDSNSVKVGPRLPGGGPTAVAADQILCVPPTGANGRLNRLTPFLNANPFQH